MNNCGLSEPRVIYIDGQKYLKKISKSPFIILTWDIGKIIILEECSHKL